MIHSMLRLQALVARQLRSRPILYDTPRWFVSASIPTRIRSTNDPKGDFEDEEVEQQPEFTEAIDPEDEMHVKIVKVTELYALCRPVHFPHLKGKISFKEVDPDDMAWDCRHLLKEQTFVKASVVDLLPPDRLTFSIRRVRPVMREDFRPCTIVAFGVPYDLDSYELEKIFQVDGNVLSVDLSASIEDTYSEDPRRPTFITFEHKADAIKAIKRWNVTKIPVSIGTKTYHRRIRTKMSHTQEYRHKLEHAIEKEFNEKMERWTESPMERRYRRQAVHHLAEIIPYNENFKESESWDLLRRLYSRFLEVNTPTDQLPNAP